MKKKYELFFIILNYNDYENTIKAANNIKENIELNNYGILIVDNNSINDSYNIILKNFNNEEDIFIIKNKVNNGYSGGNNFGAKYIDNRFPNTKFIAITNPDVRFHEKNKLKYLLDKFNSDENLASISPIHLLNNKFKSESLAWKIPKNFDDFFLNFTILSKFINNTKYKDYKIESNKISYVEVLPGSFFIIKKDIFKEVNYFDEKTFLYCEERILAKKLKNKGYKQAIDFDNFFIHDHTTQKRNLFNKIRHYNYLLKSRIYFNKKYNNLCGKLTILLLLIFYPLKIFEIILAHLIKKVKK